MKTLLKSLSVSLVSLLIFGISTSFAAIPIYVLSDQKVSDTAGSFTGIVDDTDNFGRSIANIGDLDSDGVNDLAVGAIYDDDGGTDRGAVYILFMNNDGTVKGHQKISDTVGEFTATLDDNDEFGISVAGIGDIDGDGVDDIAVGAAGDDDGGTNRGAVYIIFMDTDGTADNVFPAAHPGYQKISNTDGGFTGVLENSDALGTSVAGIGNLNGSGAADIAVGAILDNDGGSGRGAVYVMFLNTDGTVASHQKISDTEGNFTATLADFDSFGMSVANMGDLNGGGVNDLAVGASFDGVSNYGAVYILFMNTNGTVASYQKINNSEGGLSATFEADDRFGTGVANVGDMDGDGVNDLAVGTYFDNDGGSNRGAVYAILLNSNGTVKSNQVLSDTQGNFSGTLDDNDYFGFGVSGWGDIDSNGITDIVAGAPNDDDGGSDRGAFYSMFMEVGYTVSGRLYSDKGVSPVTTADKDITILVNGVVEGTDTTDVNGDFSVTGVNYSAGDVITAFLDGDATPNYGVTVTVANDAALSNMDVYYNYLIARSETTKTLTNTNLDNAHNGDPDITGIYADGGGTSLDLARNLYIPAGSTYAPGGMINIAGNWNNSGTFTAGTNTVVFDGTTQAINGSTTFKNFSKIAAAAETLTFQNGKTQNISGTLTLDGDAGKVITINSDAPGSSGIVNITSTGTIGTVDYLSIADSTLKQNGVIKDPALNVVNTTFGSTSTKTGNANGWIVWKLVYDPTNLIESSANTGAIGNNPITINLYGDTFAADVISANRMTVSNVPAGLTAVKTRVTDKQITLSLTGSASNHENANSISNLTVAFTDEAFVTHTAAEITDSTKSDLQITYNNGAAGAPTILLLSGMINEDEPEEEPEEEEEIVEEEEEVVVEEEEVVEEVVEEPVVEVVEELPVAPVIETVEEIFEPAPVAVVEEAPETPEEEVETPSGVQSGESLPDDVKSAVTSYVESGGSSRPQGPSKEEIEEAIIEAEEKGLAPGFDDNNNGVEDILELIETGDDEVEIVNQDPDNDGFTIAEEFFCDYDLTQVDAAETKVPFLGENVTTGSDIVFHICAGIEDDVIKVSIVTDGLEELYEIGEVEIDGKIGILKLPENFDPVPGKKYVVIPMGENAGLGTLTSFTVDDDVVPKAPPIEFTFEDVDSFVRDLIAYAGEAYGFDARLFIVDQQLDTMEGKISTDPYLTVYFSYQSRVYSSVVLADASGEIDIKVPQQLKNDILVQAPESDDPIDHEILVYAVDQENNFIGNVSSLIFSLQ